VAAEAAYRELRLEVVNLVPAGAPWQKADRDVSAARHRWAMTVHAASGVDYLQPDDREVARDGWTYSIETLESFPEQDRLVLILGADAAAGIPTWHRADEVLGRADLAVMPRPGVDREFVEQRAGSLHWLDTPLLPVSGTLLRQMCRSGRSIRFLVREAVYGYIEEHDLYPHE
jgi:nicotinate-nucleotide adenylyltransferase